MKSAVPIMLDVGDLEIIHPTCRTRLLITDLALRILRRENNATPIRYVAFEGICPRCDIYVQCRLDILLQRQLLTTKAPISSISSSMLSRLATRRSRAD